MDKLKNVKFLKSFSKITISGACKEENVKQQNLYYLKTTPEKIERIKKNIDRKIKELYEEYNE